MKSVLASFAILLAVGAITLVAPSLANAEAAVVVTDAGCGMLDGDGNFVASESSLSVTTNSANCNGTLTCKAKGVTNTAGTTVKFNFASTDLLCSTPAGLTEQWQEVVTKSGQASLVCHVNMC